MGLKEIFCRFERLVLGAAAWEFGDDFNLVAAFGVVLGDGFLEPLGAEDHRFDFGVVDDGDVAFTVKGLDHRFSRHTTAAEVVAGWYNETPPNDGHRRNILNCALTEIGVGYANNSASQYGTYWTQDFGER